MYVPEHFALSAQQAQDLLRTPRAGDLITTSSGGLAASFLPMLYEPGGDLGVLRGHVARVNPQWRDVGEALFISHGPQDYVAGEWLSLPGVASVPTWNYVTVHAHGELVAHPEPEWTLAVVRRLSAARGDHSLETIEEVAIEKLLRSIVGIELRITRLVGKAKMSQNKPPEVVSQVIAGLAEAGSSEASEWMCEHSLPRAQKKSELLTEIRSRKPSRPSE